MCRCAVFVLSMNFEIYIYTVPGQDFQDSQAVTATIMSQEEKIFKKYITVELKTIKQYFNNSITRCTIFEK